MSLVSCVAQKDLQEPQVLSCGGLMPAGQCAANDGRDTSTNQEKDSCSLQMHDRDAGVSQTISRLVPLSHVGDDKCGGVDLINGSLVGKKDTPGCDNDEHDVTGDHCQELSNSNHSGTIGTSESNNRARNNNISKGIEGLDVKGLFAASRTDQFSHVPTGASKPSHSPSGVAPSGLDLLLLAVTASPIPKMNNSDGSQGGADASNNSSQASNGMQVNQKIDNGTLRMYPSQSVKAPNEAAVTWSQGVKSDQHAANAHCNDGAGKLSDLLLMAVSASPIPNFNGNVHSEGGNDTLNHASSATDEMQGHLNNESQDCTMPNATKKSRNDGKPISSPAQAVVTPREADILRGRGGITNRHVGNMRFRDEARKLRAAYRDNGVSRKDKYLYSKVNLTLSLISALNLERNLNNCFIWHLYFSRRY